MLKLVAAILAGMIVGAGGLALSLPHLMFTETASPRSVDDTVTQLSAEARARGWVVSGVRKLDNSVQSNGGPDLPTIRLVELCHARHAGEILDADSDRRMAVMMPCTIAVYETAKGTRVAALNAALMGPVFGGDVGRVMGHAVARDQTAIIASAVAPANRP